jgi:lambda family phage portal protein
MYRVLKNGKDPAAPRLYRGVGGLFARAFDGMLSPFAPGFVLERQRARLRSSHLLAYDAAAKSRMRRPQVASSADQDLLGDLDEIRRNSRAMVRDDSTAAALVRVLEDNVVGTGLVPQMMVKPVPGSLTERQAEDWNRSIEQIWAEASKQLDATECDTFPALQRQAFRTMVVDGEALFSRIFVDPSKSEVRRLIGTCYESVDVDRLDDPNQFEPGIRAGVELGDRGNARAYWIRPRHPEESMTQWRDDRMRLNEPERVPRYADGRPKVLHMFRRDRPGQTRGVPFFAPCFALVEAMNDMLETELQAARAASKFCAFIKQTLDANMPHFDNEEGELVEHLESATIQRLGPGEELVPYTPNRPGNMFEPFVVRVMRSICSALGLPYELVMKDFGKMNYSNARVALLESRRGFAVLQQLVVEKLCQPMLEAVVHEAVVKRKVEMPRGFLVSPSMFVKAYWQPPAWGWVDPVKEVQSSGMAVDLNLSSPQAEAARQGGDSEANLRMKAAHMKKAREIEKEHGLPEGSLTSSSSAPAPAPRGGAEEDEDDNAPEEAETE